MIDFDEDQRGLQRYRDLRDDVHDSVRLPESLALFCRIVITEGGGGTRWCEFNRFDLLNPVAVPKDFGQLRPLTGAWSSYIPPPGSASDSDQRERTVGEFIDTAIIHDGKRAYSIDDLVRAVAYNRGIHNRPDDPRLEHLYQSFVKANASHSERLLRWIGRCLVDTFAHVYDHFVEPGTSLHCHVRGRQPRIVTLGKVEPDGAIYENAWTQVALYIPADCGIRLSLRLRLLSTIGEGQCIAAIGHRATDTTCFELRHVGRSLAVRSSLIAKASNVEVQVTDEMVRRAFVVEFACYPRGHIAIGLDEWLRATGRTSALPSFGDGKLIVGTDLYGENGHYFACAAVSVERLDRRNITQPIHYSSTTKLLPAYQPVCLGHRELWRPNLLA